MPGTASHQRRRWRFVFKPEGAAGPVGSFSKPVDFLDRRATLDGGWVSEKGHFPRSPGLKSPIFGARTANCCCRYFNSQQRIPGLLPAGPRRGVASAACPYEPAGDERARCSPQAATPRALGCTHAAGGWVGGRGPQWGGRNGVPTPGTRARRCGIPPPPLHRLWRLVPQGSQAE